MSDEINELEARKAQYIEKIKLTGEMSLNDVTILRNFDYQIYMARHPLLKKFDNWIYPETNKKNDWKTKLKGIVRRLAVLPVSIGYNLSLNMAATHWEKKNIKEHAPNKKNKKKLRRMKFVKMMKEFGFTPELALADIQLPKPTNVKLNKVSVNRDGNRENDIVPNKLATLRKKIAHDIDETLGTHLEEKKIAKPIKKIEKAVSDKLFGKVNE